MKIGITSTIPSEIILAAGHTLVDLNNIFVSSPSPRELVAVAENDGYPSSCCGWIRGIYGTVKQLQPADAILTVTGGDCSNTHAMAETFKLNGNKIIPFSFPLTRSRSELERSMCELADVFEVTLSDAEVEKAKLESIRADLDYLDEALSENRISFEDYHLLALSSSDYNSDVDSYAKSVKEAVLRAGESEGEDSGIRIALIGVPPIISNLHEMLLECGLNVVFDEIPRQFTMPDRSGDIVDQYLKYSYPYGMTGRIPDIGAECARRDVRGIIHYTQSFCFRAIEDVVLKRSIDLPILTIEGDEPAIGDERLRLRLESFAEMIEGV